MNEPRSPDSDLVVLTGVGRIAARQRVLENARMPGAFDLLENAGADIARALDLLELERHSFVTPRPVEPIDMLNPVRIKLAENGERLPDTATDHAAVYFPEYARMIDVRRPQHADSQQECEKLGAALDLFGLNDWMLGDDRELQLPIERGRFSDSACDPVWFPNFVKLGDWCWTRTTRGPSSSGNAYVVLFSGGLVGWNGRLNSGFAVGVRRVPAGQF